MSIIIRYSFYPVGQGIFSSGAIKSPSLRNDNFNWVYDCGSVKENSSILEMEIRRLKKISLLETSNHRPKINLVFISHFDIDHISGLVELLKNFDVDTLVIPYVPIWQRIVLTITSSSFHDFRYQHFMANPISFVDSIEHCNVSKVIFVLPSDKANPDDYNERFNDPISPSENFPPLEIDESNDLPEGHEIYLSAKHSRMTVTSLRPGGRLILDRFWEFVPYNDPSRNIKATPHFRLAANRVGNALLQSNDSATRSKILFRLKLIYQRTFGSSPKNKNEISLFLYCGPLNRRSPLWKSGTDIPRAALASNPCSSGHCYICSTELEHSHDKCSILYTGDGYLSSKPKIRKLRDYLGVNRLDYLDVFQVMHHGSDHNWRKGLAADFTPNESIFCADPSYKYKHPNKNVMNDFSSYSPRVINDEGISRFYKLNI